MVKNLFIIRHAEASEAQRGDKDVERTLTQKGYKDASRLGNYFKEQGIIPDVILVSNADRAATTADLMADQMGYDKEKVILMEELYNASARVFLNIVNDLDDTYNNVMIVGHNPTLVYFSEYVTKKNLGNLSPGGMIHIRFEIDSWKEVSDGNGYLDLMTDPDKKKEEE
jgi:phosphohistidine phosphatase